MELNLLLLFAAAAFLVAAVVVASGFGLGTTLTPLFLLVYDIKVAVLMVAVVHLANNLFKFALFRQHVDRALLQRFGLLSIAGALAGSFWQGQAGMTGLETGLGVLLIVLGGMQLAHAQGKWRIPQRFDYLGGFGSGLLGGMLGNQGALRSGYLLNYPLSKEAFIATGTAIACLIDLSRIPVYLLNYQEGLIAVWPYLAVVTSAAMAGTFVGKRFVDRIPVEWFRRAVGSLVVLAGLAIAARSISETLAW